MAYIKEFSNDKWTAMIEDDDNVGYAYLLHQKRIVSDVWLYNRRPAPEVAPWKDADAKMPYLNPVEFVADDGTIQEISPNLVSVSWSGGVADPEVAIWIDSRLIAWLAPSVKPGWSALVKRTGPLARVREGRG